ncbi:GNAT family N-acetyltransferase [Marinomonas posidonica]|uniref:GCN5-related N-acetyltransferase n=1 Tax=Marinomonas posidonica (strain CECT 7376 / NCIMB 14433 / IVIA-Po-181) TaxID=491952 RepID=F6CXW4_MARPP|nr:GNAT family N-acetyltransferase [Marinomonas posidonica]AEF54526.1 GCN5-related N-acetyltransferase [Marinomonas posidonica IVIA-Po-181]
MTVTQTPLSISYRAMTEADLNTAYTLSQAVKWPHRIDDWKMVHHLGSGFVAEYHNQPIGTVLCWDHGEKYSSLGMVIVSPEKQGNGIGRQLMNQILDEIGEQKNVLLFATPSGQPLYESFGFRASGTVYQHQAIVENAIAIETNEKEELRHIDREDYAKIAKLAETACGLTRATTLNEILKSASGIAMETQGDITGFALIRQFGRGYAIGPVIASSQEQAKVMIQSLINDHINEFVRIDIPQSSELNTWLTEIGLPQVDTVVEMVRGEIPQRDSKIRQFALISQALG